MRKITYVDYLDAMREQDLRPREGLLESARIPRRRESTERVVLRLAPEQRAFLKEAAKDARGDSIDASAIVAGGLAVLQDLGIDWAAVSSRKELMDAIRRRLRARLEPS
jgi:hypothetical protein